MEQQRRPQCPSHLKCLSRILGNGQGFGKGKVEEFEMGRLLAYAPEASKLILFWTFPFVGSFQVNLSLIGAAAWMQTGQQMTSLASLGSQWAVPVTGLGRGMV